MWVPRRRMQAEMVIQTNTEEDMPNRPNDDEQLEESSSSLSIFQVRPDDVELSEGLSSSLSIVDVSPSISNSGDSSYSVIEVISSLSDRSGNSLSPKIEECQDQSYLPTSVQTPVPLEGPISSDNSVSPKLEGTQEESYFPSVIQTTLPVGTPASVGNSLSPKTESSQDETNSPPALQTPSPVESPVLLPTGVTMSEPRLRYARFTERHKKNCEEWLYNFEAITVTNGDSSNVDRTRIFGGLMKGVRDWYTDLPQVTKDDWIELKKAYLQEFKEQPSYKVFAKLHDIELRDQKSVRALRECFHRVQGLANTLNLDQNVTMWFFIRKLPDKIKKFVLLGKPSSIHEAYEAAQIYVESEDLEKYLKKEEEKRRKKKSGKKGSSCSSSLSSSDFGDSETDSGMHSSLGNSRKMNKLTMNSSYESTSYHELGLGREIRYSPRKYAPRQISASQSFCQAPTTPWIEPRQNFHRRMHWAMDGHLKRTQSTAFVQRNMWQHC